MIKAYSYNRVSTKDQEREGHSIPAQVDSTQTYAKRHDIEIVREFKEADSAGKAGRKLFGEMLELLKRDSSVRTVLVEKTDRLYRNFFDQVKLADLDVDIHFVKDGRIIGKNSRPSDKFAHDIETAQARYYVNNLSEDVKKGQRQAAKEGKYPGGMVSIGYLRNRLTKTIDIDPLRAPIIRNLFELYAQGNQSLDDLHSFAKQARLTYPRSGRVIARSEIERMLKKEFYTSKFIWNGILYPGNHPAIVDPHLFDKVQKAFQRRSNGKFAVRDFTFGRLIACECGCLVTAEVKKGKYIYYHCTGYGHRHKKVYVPESVLNGQFAGVVKKATLPLDWYEYMKTKLELERSSARIQLACERERLESSRDKIMTCMKKAFQAHIDGTVDDNFFKEVHNDQQRELDALNYRLANLQESVENDFDIALQTIELSHQAESLYVRANPDQKRHLLTSILSNSVLNGATLSATYRKPFDLLAKGIESENMRRGRDSPLRQWRISLRGFQLHCK